MQCTVHSTLWLIRDEARRETRGRVTISYDWGWMEVTEEVNLWYLANGLTDRRELVAHTFAHTFAHVHVAVCCKVMNLICCRYGCRYWCTVIRLRLSNPKQTQQTHTSCFVSTINTSVTSLSLICNPTLQTFPFVTQITPYTHIHTRAHTL